MGLIKGRPGVYTHFYKFHEAHGKIIDFAGFRMPISYTSVLEEALAVRNAAGLFDVTHMGRSLVHGKEAEGLLNYISTNDVRDLAVGQGHYSLICNEAGGIKDDVTVFRLAEDRFLMVYNAVNRKKIGDWLATNASGHDVFVTDVSDEMPMLAIQGPLAMAVLQKITDFDLSAIKRFGLTEIALAGRRCLVSRTGYTGEDGFEIYLLDTPLEMGREALAFWATILEAGAGLGLVPCGLGARDVLRIEAGLCLYGNDIDEGTSPFEAGLGFAVKLDKGEFIGRAALEEEKKGVRRKRVGIRVFGPSFPRKGDLITKGSEEIGVITSGTYSPILKQGVGMGYVKAEHSAIGERLRIKSHQRILEGELTGFPFYDPRKYGRTREKLMA